jgi:putative nucleotidyltransferase with HDIG domain
MLNKIKTLIKEECSNPNFKHHKWFWDYHIIPMKDIALELAEKLQVDKELVELIAYLHDIAKIRGLDNHAETGAEIALEILKDHPKKGLIAECIRKHNKPSLEDRIEVKLIASADAVSHFLTPFFEIYFWENPDKDVKDIISGNLRKMEKDWNRIFLEEAKDICRKEYEALKRVHLVKASSFLSPREYQNGAFCKAVNCEIRKKWRESSKDFSELKEICQKECIKTAYEFHDWLIEQGFLIKKVDSNIR